MDGVEEASTGSQVSPPRTSRWVWIGPSRYGPVGGGGVAEFWALEGDVFSRLVGVAAVGASRIVCLPLRVSVGEHPGVGREG